MNKQLKKILAVMCITMAGTVIAATPTSPTLTGVTAPAEIFDGDNFTFHIQGTGLCSYDYDVGGNKYSHEITNKSTSMPNWVNTTQLWKFDGNENFHVHTIKVTATGTCKSPNGQPVTVDIKVKKKVPNNPVYTSVIAPAIIMPFTASCPAPYLYHTDNSDGGKGEYYCKKAEPTCPAGWTGSVDKVTGTLTCTSLPQPDIACQKSTPTWQWGAKYYKEGWNRMGCIANLKPAY